MEKINAIRKQVTEYCIQNRNAVINFSGLSDEDRERVYELAASVVFTRDNIMQGGGFIQAIIANDLESAVGRADDIAIRCLKLLVFVKYNFRLK